eukprot:scaffold1690_cov366-Prasinococcus_capsulatus_cf.AAC.2
MGVLTLRDGREHLVGGQEGGHVLSQAQALEAGVGEQRGVHDTLVEFAQARLDVAPEVDHLEGGMLVEELGLAAQGGAADDGRLGELAEGAVLEAHEGVAHVLARQVAVEHGALGQVRGHVLHGVHGDVDAAVQEGLVDLLGEEALAANVRQGLAEHLVAGGLDHHDLQRALLRQVRVRRLEQVARHVRLRQGQRRAAGADLDRGRARGARAPARALHLHGGARAQRGARHRRGAASVGEAPERGAPPNRTQISEAGQRHGARLAQPRAASIAGAPTLRGPPCC